MQSVAFPLFAGPLVLTVHNLEEACTMPLWVSDHAGFISSLFPAFVHVHFNTLQLYSSLLFATILPWVTAIGVAVLGGKRHLTIVAIILNSIILINLFIPHLLLSVILFAYNPGFFTAVFINFPVTLMMLRGMYRSGLVDGKEIRSYFLLSLLLYVPVILCIHYGGQLTEYFIR
jgi:hypothetical protein